jgi:N-acetylglutamate synthase-like GNAT family acetyltransferase
MHIAQAEDRDAEAILTLQKLAYQSEAILNEDFTIPPLTQTLDSITADFERQVFLKAIIDGQIIGSVRAYQEKDTCYIGRLIVHPDHQGQGIGSQLLRRIEQAFNEVDRYELFTGQKSARNICFYERRGYHLFHTEKIKPGLSLVYLEKTANPMQTGRY